MAYWTMLLVVLDSSGLVKRSQEESSQMTNSKLPSAEQIEQRAYALYLERGGQDGYALEDWLAAERELAELSELEELTEPSAPPALKARAASANQQAISASSGEPARHARAK